MNEQMATFLEAKLRTGLQGITGWGLQFDSFVRAGPQKLRLVSPTGRAVALTPNLTEGLFETLVRRFNLYDEAVHMGAQYFNSDETAPLEAALAFLTALATASMPSVLPVLTHSELKAKIAAVNDPYDIDMMELPCRIRLTGGTEFETDPPDDSLVCCYFNDATIKGWVGALSPTTGAKSAVVRSTSEQEPSWRDLPPLT